MSDLPTNLQTIVDDFTMMEGEEKLEYLLELAERLPPLPDHLRAKRDEMDVVHECMTPVFLDAERNSNGGFHFHFDVSPESPTVRGFAELLRSGLDGVRLDELMAVPAEFYLRLGLQRVLSGQRLNGISAILAHMKKVAQAAQA